MYDISGKVMTIEAISADGEKDFLRGGKKRGCFYPLGKIRNAKRILIGEGLATVAAAFSATELPAIAAMDSGNLEHAARAVKELALNTQLVFLADNDVKLDGSNPGIEAATKAARAVSGKVAIPELDGKKCDFWDLWHERGAEAVREAVENAQSAGADRPSVTAFTSSQPYSRQAWPKLEGEAYYGLLGDIVKAIEPYTEADPVAVLANVLCAFGGVVGRASHFCVEATKHFTNEFFVMVGETAKARKGQSWSTARKMFKSVDPQWTITSGLSSGEGLIYAVRDQVVKKKARKQGGLTVYEDVVEDEGVADKRLLIVEQEFSQALKVMSREGNILSVTLRQAWDGDDLHPLTKNNPIRATEPQISIIAHITTEELLRHLTETEMANGFGNRFIWLLAKRSKEIPSPTGVPSHILNPLILKLAEAVQFARTVEEIQRDEVAEKLWANIYPKLSAGQPGLTGSMLARSEAHVMRIASIYALADLSKSVRTEHLKAALCLWDYSDESVRLIFGVKTGDLLADRIYRLVKEVGGSMRKWDTINALGRNYSKERVDTALDTLERGGLLKLEDAGQDGRGRPKVIFKALR